MPEYENWTDDEYDALLLKLLVKQLGIVLNSTVNYYHRLPKPLPEIIYDERVLNFEFNALILIDGTTGQESRWWGDPATRALWKSLSSK